MLVALLAASGLVVVLGVLYLYVLPRTSPTTGAATAALQSPGGAGSAESPHPLAKHLELAGLRITESTPQTAKIQFLIINHSRADLPDLKLQVALRPSAGGSPIFEFPADLPSIGPYESREMMITLKTALKPYEIPDWQLLRAEFRVTSAEQ
jgi:hypothetical protein